MTDNNRIRRDMLFLYSGVALGALLGMIGSMFVAWWFETYKNEKWMPYIAWLSFAFVLLTVIFMVRKISQWEKELAHEELVRNCDSWVACLFFVFNVLMSSEYSAD